MEKKKNEDSFSLFNSVGGIITTIITVGSCLFGIGWAIGSWRTEIKYENIIRDLKYETLRLEVEFHSKLQEEKEKWIEEQNHKLTMEEVSLFIKNFNEYQKGEK